MHKKVMAHMIEGIMFHKQLEDYFRFLGFEKLADDQEERFISESKEYAKFACKIMHMTNRLCVPGVEIKESIIPSDWALYNRQDVDNSTRSRHLRNGVDRWITWEKDTLELYEQSYFQLFSEGRIKEAQLYGHLVFEVCSELHSAEQLNLDCSMLDYDPSNIGGLSI